MSFQATRWARDQRTGSSTAKLILLVLAEHADVTGRCFLALATVAFRAELGLSAVKMHMARLVSTGLAVRTRRFEARGRRTSDYIQLMMEPPAQGPPGEPGDQLQGPPSDPGELSKVHDVAALGPPRDPYKVLEKKRDVEATKSEAIPRKKPETSIGAGFPHAEALAQERAYLMEKGWNIDADLQAEKFRAHVLANDRRYRNWEAAFHKWVMKAIEFAPPGTKSVASTPAPPPSQDAVWRQRLQGMKANQWWNEGEWGPRPNRAGCKAPPVLMAEFGWSDRVGERLREGNPGGE